MKNCDDCGREIPDESSFCPYCGKAVRTEGKNEMPADTPQESGTDAAKCEEKRKPSLSGNDAVEKWANANGFNGFIAKADKLIFALLAVLAGLFGLLALLNYMDLLGLYGDPFIPLAVVFAVFAMVWYAFCSIYVPLSLCRLSSKYPELDLNRYAGEQTSYKKSRNAVNAAYFNDVKGSFTQWTIYFSVAWAMSLACVVIAAASFIPIIGTVIGLPIEGAGSHVPDFLLDNLVRIIVCGVLCVGFAVAAHVLNAVNFKAVTGWYVKTFDKAIGD